MGTEWVGAVGNSVREALKTRPEDQPLPGAGRVAVQDALIDLVKERRDLGIRRYGRPLETFNGRDAVRDALEEAVDLAVYLMQIRLEVAELRDRTVRAENERLGVHHRAVQAIDRLLELSDIPGVGQTGVRDQMIAILDGGRDEVEEKSALPQ